MGLQKASGVAYYTVSIPQAVGTIAIAETVVLGVIAVLMVSIPQAVGTIAIDTAYFDGVGISVSIPQAVGTIAMVMSPSMCVTLKQVSIPQAVGTIAIF